jgi:hypothetical protein
MAAPEFDFHRMLAATHGHDPSPRPRADPDAKRRQQGVPPDAGTDPADGQVGEANSFWQRFWQHTLPNTVK